MYHSYIGLFSIIFLAVVGADYKFKWVDVGENGFTSDFAVFSDSDLRSALEDGTLAFPPGEPLSLFSQLR